MINTAVYKGLSAGIKPLVKEIQNMKDVFMSTVDELNAAIDNQYNELLPALGEVHDGLRELREQLANGVTASQLSETLARVSGSTNRIRNAIAAVIDNPETPDPSGDLPNLPGPVPEEPVVADGSAQDVPVIDDSGNVPEGDQPEIQ